MSKLQLLLVLGVCLTFASTIHARNLRISSDCSPVCGSDGRTYKNEYELKSKNCGNKDLTIQHIGRCNNNYSGVTIMPDEENHDGEKPETSQPAESSGGSSKRVIPNNGSSKGTSDGTYVTRSNDGSERSSGGTSNGSSEEYSEGSSGENHDVKVSDYIDVFDVPDESNLAEFDPVCGNNGKNYSNSDALKYLNKKFGEEVEVAYKGICKEDYPGGTSNGGSKENHDGNTTDSVNGCDLPDVSNLVVFNPICGTDGNNYSNGDALEYYNKKYGKEVKVGYEGPCKEDCPGGTSNGSSKGFSSSTNCRTDVLPLLCQIIKEACKITRDVSKNRNC